MGGSYLIAADMEGVAGISDYRECLPSHPSAYARGRELMTLEAAAAARALLDAGAGRVVVGDWHMVGTNILRGRMPGGVEVRPIADLALEEAEPSMAKAAGGDLAGVVLLGHHASTASPRGFCSHTFVWEMDVRLDGDPLNETQVYAQALAGDGTPVLVAAGDHWMLEELGEGELGGARLIATKEGQGRARATPRDSASVRTEIRAAIEAAVGSPPTPPARRGYPAELRIALAGRELARTMVGGPSDLLSAIAEVFRQPRVSREYRQLARLLPAEDGTLATKARRRFGSAVATLPMLAKERAWLQSRGA